MIEFFLIIITIAVVLYYNIRKSRDRMAPRGQADDFQEQHSEYRAPNGAFREWEESLSTIWEGPSRTIEFTYRAADEEVTRRQVQVHKVLKDKKGRIYLDGYCLLRNEPRTFNFERIKSSITDNNQKYNAYDWLTDGIGLKQF